MGRFDPGAQGREAPDPVEDPQPRGPRARARGGDAIDGARGKPLPWLEPALWLAVIALVSPLVIYVGKPVVPLAGLFSIAAGIALGLALAGRRLHAAMLHDALRHGSGAKSSLVAAGMILLLLVLVLLGAVVALLAIFRNRFATDLPALGGP
jgi:hypothetical protein